MDTTTIKVRLKNHPYAQCHVIFDEDLVCFYSYTTPVIFITTLEEYASYDNEDYFRIVVTGTYSQTTSKQIGWFLKEYLPSLNYYDVFVLSISVLNIIIV